MHSYKTQARAAGALYIIATVAIIASGQFVGSTDSLEFLAAAAANENHVMLGTLLQVAWVLSVMFIPVEVEIESDEFDGAVGPELPDHGGHAHKRAGRIRIR